MNQADRDAIAGIIRAKVFDMTKLMDGPEGQPVMVISETLLIDALADYMAQDCDCKRTEAELDQLGHNIWCTASTFDREAWIDQGKGENL